MRHLADASLVMTVLDEAPALPAFLRSLERQTVAPREIVVVDGGSADDTVTIIEGWKPPNGVTVRVVAVPGAGIAEGRNAGIELTSFDTVAVTDGGTELDPGWLEELMAALNGAGSPDIASGFFRPTGTTLLERAIAYTITPRLAEIAADSFLPSSRSIAFTKRSWRSVGGYPEWIDYCEDLVFDLDLRSTGARFQFVPAATVTWRGRSTLRGLARQYYRYARGDGKAGLWPRRHAARYGAYGLAAVILLASRADPRGIRALTLGFAGYQWKFARRIFAARADLGWMTVPVLGLVPAVVVAGDAAKMAGYPAGVLWRRRRADTDQRSAMAS
jgi:glycosyltransferase involved in cell wall biosynthesis